MKTSPEAFSERRWLWIILACAFVARLDWMLTHDVQSFDEYWGIVRRLLAGRGFALPEDGRIAPTHIRAPLYPILLAAIWLFY